jgi:uncharacterized membrane protein YfcA
MTSPLYPVAGFIVGLLVALTGVGGGSLMTPILILLGGVAPVTAVGTDLLLAAATKTVGTAFFGLERAVEWRIVWRLAMGSLPGAALSLFALSQVLQEPAAGRALSVLLGIVVMCGAAALFFRGAMFRWASRNTLFFSKQRRESLTVATGLLLGALGMVVLVLLYRDLPASRLIATDIAHAVPLTLLAGFGHWWLGSIDWALLGSLLMGSVPGVLLGCFLATRIPDSYLRPVLATVLLFVGVRLVY